MLIVQCSDGKMLGNCYSFGKRSCGSLLSHAIDYTTPALKSEISLLYGIPGINFKGGCHA